MLRSTTQKATACMKCSGSFERIRCGKSLRNARKQYEELQNIVSILCKGQGTTFGLSKRCVVIMVPPQNRAPWFHRWRLKSRWFQRGLRRQSACHRGKKSAAKRPPVSVSNESSCFPSSVAKTRMCPRPSALDTATSFNPSGLYRTSNILPGRDGIARMRLKSSPICRGLFAGRCMRKSFGVPSAPPTANSSRVGWRSTLASPPLSAWCNARNVVDKSLGCNFDELHRTVSAHAYQMT